MQKDLHAVWQGILGEVELSLSTPNYTVYWSKTVPVSFDGNEMIFEVPNIYVQKNLQTKYDKMTRDMWTSNSLTPSILTYVVPASSKKLRISRETTAEASPRLTASDLQQFNTSGTGGGYKPTPSPLSSRGNLNPRYTFDNFIVGSSNDLAYSVSQAAAVNPGVKYNPIYFYGGVGLGKTHLMQAIGNEILNTNPEARVLYVSSETFVNEFLDYIRFKKKGFSDKYRNVDVLIVDDMQFSQTGMTHFQFFKFFGNYANNISTRI